MTKTELIEIIKQAPNEELDIIVWNGDDNIEVTDIGLDTVNGFELVIVAKEYEDEDED